MRTYWLSFCDGERPKGQQFLGVAVVDVTVVDVIASEAIRPAHDPWAAAAIRKSWIERCNPGGEVLLLTLTDDPKVAMIPRNVLMPEPELKRLDLI